MQILEEYRISKRLIFSREGNPDIPSNGDYLNTTDINLIIDSYYDLSKLDFTLLNEWRNMLTNLTSFSMTLKTNCYFDKFDLFNLFFDLSSHNLRELYINLGFNNKIQDEGCRQIANCLSSQPHLQRLTLIVENKNYITGSGMEGLMTGLSTCTELLELEMCFADSTLESGVVYIHKGLQSLHILNKLTLTFFGVKLGEDGGQGLGEGLSHLQRLEYLKLRFQTDCDLGQKGSALIFEGISKLTELREYSLEIIAQYNSIGDFGVQVGKSLSKLDKLETLFLEIEENSILQQGAEELGKGLTKLKSLTSLTIILSAANKIGEIGLMLLFDGIQQLQQLKVLKFKISWGFLQQGEEVSRALCNCFKNLLQLQTLSIVIPPQCQWSEQGYAYLAEGLSYQQQLINLELTLSEGNIVKVEEGKAFGRCLDSLTHLENLRLVLCSNNYLVQESMVSIGNGIRNLKSLKQLIIKINENGLNIEGMEGIQIAIENLVQLQTLQISIGDENNIQAEGVEKLSKGIGNLRNLKKLTLDFSWFNYIQNEGARFLAASIMNLSKLQYLFIIIGGLNDIGKEGAFHLSKSLTYLLQLQDLRLFITNNKIQQEGLDSIIKGVGQVKSLQQFQYCFNKEPNQQQKMQVLKKKNNKLIKIQFIYTLS